MGDSILSLNRLTILLSGIFLAGVATAYSQETGPTSQARASAGMTSGLPGGVSNSGRQIEMMQVRNAAQQSQYEAAAAQMSRSADHSIEERHQKRAVENARETKMLKKDATNRMKWERSANAYSKISADQMSTWKDNRGNVRVERNVPNEFLLALRQEEAQLAAESTRMEKRGFHPLRATKNAVGNVVGGAVDKVSSPFRKGEPTPRKGLHDHEVKPLPQAGNSGESKKGFMKNLRPPKLPFSGGGARNKKIAEARVANGGNTQAAAVRVGSNSSGAAPASTVGTTPGRVPKISGAALVDGRSPVGSGQTSSRPVSSSMKRAGDYGAAASATAQTQVSVPSAEPEKKGFFAKRKSSGPSRSGGGFGFGKKKSKSNEPVAVDASLFPSSGPSQASGGGELVSEMGSSEVVSVQQTGAIQQTGPVEQVQLPGQTREKKKRKISMLKPSIPSLSKAESGENKKSKGAANSPLTTFNANGNDFYHVAGQAQFMRYGESQMESEISVLPAGVLVKMTKPGAEWASIELNDGTKGVIKVRNLQAASSGSIPSSFGTPAPSAAKPEQ